MVKLFSVLLLPAPLCFLSFLICRSLHSISAEVAIIVDDEGVVQMVTVTIQGSCCYSDNAFDDVGKACDGKSMFS
jgi:hypothetical protein